MAPEQWRNDDVSAATDQYALGIVIYTLVAGRVPFEAPTPYQLMSKHLNDCHCAGDNVPAGVGQGVPEMFSQRVPEVA
jgi:serine/threonine protein kinase